MTEQITPNTTVAAEEILCRHRCVRKALAERALSPFQNTLDVTQLVQCLQRCQVVHIQMEQFVAYLR